MSPALPNPALLLLGPTGSGKTPLGGLCEREGLWGRRARHVDFGARLRGLSALEAPAPPFTVADRDLARAVTAQGRLLEDRDFPLAERIVRQALAGAGPEDVVVLNGLPRHAGQARDLGRLLRVGLVVLLDCPDGEALARIAADAGGDRAGRADDARAAVLARLRLFRERTAPLVGHYRAAGAAVLELPVRPGAEPGDLRRAILAAPPPAG